MLIWSVEIQLQNLSGASQQLRFPCIHCFFLSRLCLSAVTPYLFSLYTSLFSFTSCSLFLLLLLPLHFLPLLFLVHLRSPAPSSFRTALASSSSCTPPLFFHKLAALACQLRQQPAQRVLSKVIIKHFLVVVHHCQIKSEKKETCVIVVDNMNMAQTFSLVAVRVGK